MSNQVVESTKTKPANFQRGKDPFADRSSAVLVDEGPDAIATPTAAARVFGGPINKIDQPDADTPAVESGDE